MRVEPRAALLLAMTWVAAALVAPTLRAQGLPAEDVALLLSAQEGGSLALESAAVVWSVGADAAELRVSLELPVAGLAPPQAEEVELRWAVYVVDDGGAVVASRSQSVAAEGRRLATSGRAGVRILESLEIPLARVSVRTLVRELGSQRFGLRVLEVDPAARRAFVARRPEGWIELGGAAAGASPAALATVRAGGELELLVPSGGDDERAAWILRRVGAEGSADGAPEDLLVTVTPATVTPATVTPATVTPATVTPAAATPPGGNGWTHLRASLPAGIAGRYRLLRRGESAAGAPEVYALPESEQAVSWPQTVADRPDAPAPPAPLPSPGEGRVRDMQLHGRLRESLMVLARDGAGPGIEALFGVIDEAWTQAGSDGMAAVMTEMLALADAAVRAEPASLPALLAAFDRLQDQCAERGSHGCSGVLRAVQMDLLRGAEAAAPDEVASIADAWALLGRQAIARQAFGQAIDSLRHALRLQPRQLEPRVALAKVYEIAGEYRLAAGVLRELLEIHPAAAEARLRLGVQQRRLGWDRAALATLAAVSEEGPDWVRVVATQELAALQRERGEAARAEETLRQGIERFADDEQLTLQLAVLQDAAGHLDAASALLDELDEPGGHGRTPRNLYSRWPPRDLDSARERLRELGATRHPSLAAALLEVVP